MKRRWTRRTPKTRPTPQERAAEQLSLITVDDREPRARSRREFNAAEEPPEDEVRLVNRILDHIGCPKVLPNFKL